ncbi:hypothetical protein ACFL2X_00585 [Candidatus Latescibacterota bacterium]
MTKAILLLSGGLDSTLAGKLLLELGIDVEAVNFVSPFCQCTPKSLGCSAAKKAAEQLGIPVKIFSTGMEYLEIIKKPKFGRGSGMNPCLDCRIHFFEHAKKYMNETGADFIATGEVLGERPMSQRRDAIELIERESDLKGLILRPLSAKLFPPTIAEEKNLVDRNRLLDFHGRGRSPQIELAEELGIKDFLCPAGGCRLTDPEFAVRLKDLFEHNPECGINDVNILKFGRHYRISESAKAIVGRDKSENESFENLASDGDILLIPTYIPGPSVLCRGVLTEDEIKLAGRIAASHTKGGTVMEFEVKYPDNKPPEIISNVEPLDKETVIKLRIGTQS